MTRAIQKATAVDLSNATTKQLRAELANALKLTATHIMRLAMIWDELERRGEDLSALRNGIGKYLPLVASGKLLAETLVAFAGEPAMLRRASNLQIADQRKAIELGRIPEEGPAFKDVPTFIDVESTPQHAVARRGRGRPPMKPPAPTTGESLPARRIGDMVGAASPKDVADMCLEMIEGSCNPKEVAKRLMPKIEDLVGDAMVEDETDEVDPHDDDEIDLDADWEDEEDDE